MSEEIRKLLMTLDAAPNRALSFSDAAIILRAVVKAQDEQAARTLATLTAVLTGAIQALTTSQNMAATTTVQELKGYIDGKAAVLEESIRQAKAISAAWN